MFTNDKFMLKSRSLDNEPRVELDSSDLQKIKQATSLDDIQTIIAMFAMRVISQKSPDAPTGEYQAWLDGYTSGWMWRQYILEQGLWPKK